LRKKAPPHKDEYLAGEGRGCLRRKRWKPQLGGEEKRLGKGETFFGPKRASPRFGKRLGGKGKEILKKKLGRKESTARSKALTPSCRGQKGQGSGSSILGKKKGREMGGERGTREWSMKGAEKRGKKFNQRGRRAHPAFGSAPERILAEDREEKDLVKKI